MPNGVAVALPATPAPCSQSVEVEIGEAIGRAAASAAEVLAMGLAEYYDGGGLTPTIRTLTGEKIATLYELRQQLGEAEFEAIARQRGRRELQARHAAGFRAEYGAEFPADTLINGVLLIVAKVAEHEMALAH